MTSTVTTSVTTKSVVGLVISTRRIACRGRGRPKTYRETHGDGYGGRHVQEGGDQFFGVKHFVGAFLFPRRHLFEQGLRVYTVIGQMHDVRLRTTKYYPRWLSPVVLRGQPVVDGTGWCAYQNPINVAAQHYSHFWRVHQAGHLVTQRSLLFVRKP